MFKSLVYLYAVSFQAHLIKKLYTSHLPSSRTLNLYERPRSREGKSYPLQYSGLENSMDYTVHGVAESDTTEPLSLFLMLIFPFLKQLASLLGQFLMTLH